MHLTIYFFFTSLSLGGITTGAVSDLLDSRAISCVVMMYLAVPTVGFQFFLSLHGT